MQPPPGFQPVDPQPLPDGNGSPSSSSPSAGAPLDAPPPGFSPVDPAPVSPFSTPSGEKYTPGQTVQNSDGVRGEVQGKNPQSGNADIKWHLPDASTFKVGQIVSVNGETRTVIGKDNAGKLITEGSAGDFGSGQGVAGWVGKHLGVSTDIKHVSPADISFDPGDNTSAASGIAHSVLKTGQGLLKFGHNIGLSGDDTQLDNAVQNTGTAESKHASGKVGEFIGDLAQFFFLNGVTKAGEAVPTAVTELEAFAKATKVAKSLEEHPLMAKILHSAINGSAIQGTIGGLQGGGTAGSFAKNAAIGAVAQPALELGAVPALKAIPGAVGAVKDFVAHPVTGTGDLISAATDKAGSLTNKLFPGTFPEEIPNSDLEDYRGLANDAQQKADQAGGPEALAQHPATQTANILRDAADASQSASETAAQQASEAAAREGGPEALAQHPATQEAEQFRRQAAAAREAANYKTAPERWAASSERLSPEETRAAAQPIHTQLHDAYNQAIKDVANEDGIHFTPGDSVQKPAHAAAKAYENKAGQLYSEVDNAIKAATGKPGRFQQHDLDISDLKTKLRESIGDPEAQAKVTDALNQAQAARAKTWQIIKDNGLEDVAQKASDLTKRRFALEDLGDEARKVTSGLPDSIDDPERMNPKTFGTALKNLHNDTTYGADGRLTQALGDGADTLKKAASDAKVNLQKLKEAATLRMKNAGQLNAFAKEAEASRVNSLNSTADDLEAQASASDAAAKTQQNAKVTLAKENADKFSQQAKDVPASLRSQAQAQEDLAKQAVTAKKLSLQEPAESLKDFADRMERKAADIAAKRKSFKGKVVAGAVTGGLGYEAHNIYKVLSGR